MRFTMEVDRESDGRWIAEIPDLSGVLVYGSSRDEALIRAKALALRVIADRLSAKDLAVATSPQPLS